MAEKATIKILYMIDSLGSGGMERQLVELLRGMNGSSDFESEVVVMSDKIHYDEILSLGVKLHKIVRKARWDFSVIPRVYNVARRFQPDIIYSWSSMCSVFASPIVFFLGTAFLNGMVQSAPPSLSFKDKNYRRLKLTLPFSDIVLSNSVAGLRAYHVPDRKGICIYNGFNPDRVENLPPIEQIRRTFDITTKYVVGMVGRFNRAKDYTIYFDAAARICKQREDVTFLAIGEGPDLDGFKNYLACRGNSRIRIIGPQKNVETIMNVFTVGVLVSDARHHGEGIANAIIEYMALGKPVIATDFGGSPEIVEDGKTGFLVPSGDADTLEARIIQLLDDQDLALELGEAGRVRIAERFGIERLVDRHAALFRALAGKR